jgi:zinc transport system substrate-binding protein
MSLLRQPKAFFACFLFLVALLSACGTKELSPSKPIVLVSVAPYLYFVERIAGDTVTARSLVPPNANPHIYEPTPKEVQQLRQAALWIRLEDPSDKKAYTVLKEQNPEMRIVNVAEGIALLPLCGHHCSTHEEGKDMHIWLSPKLAAVQAKHIAQALSLLNPKHKERYESALALFLSELSNVDAHIAKLLAPKKESAILVSHPAFAYFCQDYGIEQFSIEVEGREPLPQDITQLLRIAKEYKITSVIVEPQYSSKGAQMVAENLGLPMYVIDPYSENYLENLEYIAQVIAKS